MHSVNRFHFIAVLACSRRSELRTISKHIAVGASAASLRSPDHGEESRSRSEMPLAARLPVAPVPHGLQKKGEKLDIHYLFESFNAQYFSSELVGVFVEYSKRMTMCAGTCTFHGRSGGCRIALSEPLLLLRSAEDTVATLLHEMIHAWLFLKFGVERDSADGHGPRFLAEAERVGRLAGVDITVYHDFRAEVESHLRHWWTCGKCQRIVKRAMNRAPGVTDNWWGAHVRACGGIFEKTHEPLPKEKVSRHGVVSVGGGEGRNGGAAASGKGVVRVRKIGEMFQSTAGGNAVMASRKSGVSVAPPARGVFRCPACNEGPFGSEPAVSTHLDSCMGGVFGSQVEAAPVASLHVAKPVAKWPRAYEHVDESTSYPLPRDVADSVIDLDDDDDAIERRSPPVKKPSSSRWSRWTEGTDSACAVDYGVSGDACDTPDFPDYIPESDHGEDGSQVPPATEAKVYIPPPAKAISSTKNLLSRGTELWERIETDALLDFALGIGGPCAPDGPVAELPAASGWAGGFERPAVEAGAPPLPSFPHVATHEESLCELSARFNLWQPASSPLEPVFASTAARLGLAAPELMKELRRLSMAEDGSETFFLSREAKEVLLEGTKLRGAGAIRNPGTRRSDDVPRSPAKRPRPAELGIRRALGHTGTQIEPLPKRQLHISVSRKVNSSAKSSKPVRGSRGIGGFFAKGTKDSASAIVAWKPSSRNFRAAVQQSGRSGLEKLCISTPPAARPSRPEQHSDEISGGMIEPCPICATKFPRLQLHAHLEKCMEGGSEDESVIDIGVDMAARSRTGAMKKVDLPSSFGPTCALPQQQANRNSPASASVDRPMTATEAVVECPLCSASVKRSDLQLHVDSCMSGEDMTAFV